MLHNHGRSHFHVVLSAAIAMSASLAAQHDHGDKPQAEAPVQVNAQKAPSSDPYLLDTDPVSGARLGALETQVIIQHEGRELRFASEATASAFRADPAKYLPAVDAALVKQQLPFYPLTLCPVSGDKLGETETPIDFVYQNRLVRFCCKGCKPEFLKDPAKYLDKLDESVITAQGPTYPLKACVVSGDALGGDMGKPVDVVVGNRLVRLCCPDCKKDLAADPLKYLAKLDAAAKSGKGRDEEPPSPAAGEPDHDHKQGDKP